MKDDKDTQNMEFKEAKDQTSFAPLSITVSGENGNDPSQDDSSLDRIIDAPALILGGNLFVNSSVKIAHSLGVSDKFIAITLLAGGTSMPELATCVAAAIKKKGQLALGNIIGSNIFNILLILGGSALIHPLSFAGISYVDLGALLVSALALLTACYVGKKDMLDRTDGVFFLLLFAGYMTYLIVNL